MKLTNRIAAFQNVKYSDSEGGRRPSERSSIFYIYKGEICTSLFSVHTITTCAFF
jgi:hypothetical protein